MNRRLSVLLMALTFKLDTQRFSELFHGSARAIIRSLECGLARAVASESDRLKRDGLINCLRLRYFSFAHPLQPSI